MYKIFKNACYIMKVEKYSLLTGGYTISLKKEFFHSNEHSLNKLKKHVLLPILYFTFILILITGAVLIIIYSSPQIREIDSVSSKTYTETITTTEISTLTVKDGISENANQYTSHQEDIRSWALYALEWFVSKSRNQSYHSYNDDEFKIFAIYYFVYDQIDYLADPHNQEYFQTPSETLRYKKGDCDDRSILMAALYESIGLDAAVEFVDTTGDSEIDHMICTVYYNGSTEMFQQRGEQLQTYFKLDDSNFNFLFFETPHSLLTKYGEDWDYYSKYDTGIWVTLEYHDYCTSIQRYDVEYSTYASDDALQELFTIMKYGPNPRISLTYDIQIEKDTLTLLVTVENNSPIRAKNVTVWAGFDAGNNEVYDQSETTSFNVAPYENQNASVTLKIPAGVRTRILIRVYGDNFESIHYKGEWFNT